MKKKYFEPEFILSSQNNDVIVMSAGDVDGDIIGWDPDGEGWN